MMCLVCVSEEVSAVVNLGVCNMRGIGCEKDEMKALELLGMCMGCMG